MTTRQPVDPTRSSYRRAISAAVVTHARYLAVRDEPGATPHLIERRREEWLLMEARRARLRAKIAESEQTR